MHGKSVVAKLAGCDEREAAAALQGLEVGVPREPASAQPARRVLLVRSAGSRRSATCRAETLGRVERLLETGANQVLVVHGDRERLIPFVAAIVVAVDLAQGEIVVDWGLDF